MAAKVSNYHPMVIFWLGLLTGALLVGLVFFYGAIQPSQVQDYSFGNFGAPTLDYGLNGFSLDTKSIGVPIGN
jgi:hypothetical protein